MPQVPAEENPPETRTYIGGSGYGDMGKVGLKLIGLNEILE